MTDESIFTEALAIEDQHAREVYLDAKCSNLAQKNRIADLLAASQATNPLDRPAIDIRDAATSEFRENDKKHELDTGAVIGPYRLLERIGEGGMGEVWVASQTTPINRRVALKLIKPGMDSRSVVARFEAERQALAVMDHQNIAKVFDAGTTSNGRPYFAMELVKGAPITEFCDERKLTPNERLELFIPVCQAIQHAHMKGVIHRDIKPSNVMVALHDQRPVPKVIDFGVSKAIGQQLTDKTIYTGFGVLIGTPAYMAPEQATFNQLDIDTRADVYALGVLLYELLTGSPPIDEARLRKAAIDEVLRIVRTEEPPLPSQRLSTSETKPSIAANRSTEPEKLSRFFRGELDWIVMKALDKDRSRRYETATGFAADVQRFLSGEPVLAHPPTAAYKLRKLLRRNKGPVVTLAFVFLALLAGIAGTTYGLIRAGQQRDLAIQSESLAAREAEKAMIEREKATLERDEKEKARAEELVARRAVQERVVRLHVRTGNVAMDRGEDFDAAHWFVAAWQADTDNPDRESVHRMRVNATLGALPKLQAIKIHAGALEQADFSPDGKTVLTLTQRSNEIHCWSPETGRLKYPVLSHPATIVTAEWTPDGKYIWTWASDHAVRIWNAESGQLIGGPIHSSQNGPVSAASVSPDARFALFASPDRTIELIDATTGEEIQTWSTPEEPVSVRFSPRGDRFACSLRNTAVLFDPNQAKAIATLPHVVEPIHDEFVKSSWPNPSRQRLPLFSRDGSRLITLQAKSKGFFVWDAASGDKLAEQASVGDVNGVVFSPSGKLILSFGNGSPADRCRVSETETGRVVAEFVGERNISNACFFPDEKSILYRMAGSEVCRVDIATRKLIGPPLRGCGRGLLVPQVDPEGQTLLFGDFDGIARIWKLPARDPWLPYDMQHGGSPEGFFSTTDGRLQVRQREDGNVVVVSRAAETVLQDAPGVLKKCWISSNGEFVVITNADRGNRVWSSTTGLPVTEWFNGALGNAWFPFAAFTSDGKSFYTIADESTFECRDTATWTLRTNRAIQLTDSSARYARLSSDGRFMGIAGSNNSAWIFNAVNPKANPTNIRHSGQVWALDFSPNGEFVATVSGDLTARVWASQTGRPAGPAIRFESPPRHVLFSADGKVLLIRFLNGTLRLWDWRTSDGVARFTPPQDNATTDGAFWLSNNGQFVVSKPSSSLAARCIPIGEMNLDRQDFSIYLELVTAARLDETESIVPLSPQEIRTRKGAYQNVWVKLHPDLANPDPFQSSSLARERTPVPTDVISPDEAKLRLGEIVSVRFRVELGGVSRDRAWYYLNTHEDFRDSNTFTVAISGATADRRSRLGLPEDPSHMKGKTVIARGKMGSYQNRPQLLVDDDESVWIVDP